MANTVLKGKNKAGRLTLLEFKVYYKAIVIQDRCGIGERTDKQISRTE